MRNLASQPHPDLPPANNDDKTAPPPATERPTISSTPAAAADPRQVEQLEQFLARQRAAMGFT